MDVDLVAAIASGALAACDSGPSEEDREQGFHCLDPWDGNQIGLEDLVRPLLNDPGSMETHETRIGKVGASVTGKHRIIMDFGARNAFGGMVRNTAYGWVDHETCEAELDYIE